VNLKRQLSEGEEGRREEGNEGGERRREGMERR
jgi:hypothetical protein